MKLTLNIEPGLINQIKEIAKKKPAGNTSLSKITENLFKKEVEVQNEPFKMKSLEPELSNFIKSISISGDPVPDFDHKALNITSTWKKNTDCEKNFLDSDIILDALLKRPPFVLYAVNI